jgi:hypothetical protein
VPICTCPTVQRLVGSGLGVGPNREVVVKLIGLEEAAGMTPGLGVMMALTPTEARRFADALHRTADKAEAGLPRA